MSTDDLQKYKKLFVMSTLSAYFAIFMEWLFFITKPSFFDGVSWTTKVQFFVISSGFLAFLTMLAIISFAGLHFMLGKLNSHKIFLYFASFVPAFILAVLGLLLIDNFTYTVFKIGIVSFEGWWRLIYTLGFTLGILYVWRRVHKFIGSISSAYLASLPIIVFAIGVQLFFVFLSAQHFVALPFEDKLITVTDSSEYPNIILIGPDGVNAENMSVYGYDRDTTPFLSQTSASALIAENNFSNFNSSQISVMTMLTGKTTETVNVSYTNDILKGADAYQHLPGILRDLGYFTVQFGVPTYVDANNINLQNGFDIVNAKKNNEFILSVMGQKYGFDENKYFVSQIFDRVSQRLTHLYFIQNMKNPFDMVTNPKEYTGNNDSEKIKQIVNLITTHQEPVFIHAHLMGTHGPLFSFRTDHFSSGQEQNDEWLLDFYDDAILDFDRQINEMFEMLADANELDNTLVIIYTDHNQLYRSDQRTPLIFYFPHGDNKGVIHNNTQNLDIAPTILAYLKVRQPDWMQGQSLLQGEPPRERLIFSGSADILKIVYCDLYFEFTPTGFWRKKIKIPGHTNPCQNQNLSAKEELPQSVVEQVNKKGWEISSTVIEEDVSQERISRSEMAIALLEGKYGEQYVPPRAKGVFQDVPLSDSASDWIEQAYFLGIIDACGESPLSYCPAKLVTRAQAAKYLLKAKEGGSYQPPKTGKRVFADVPTDSQYVSWIEELYEQKITIGCSPSPMLFCPDSVLLREQLDIFLLKIFSHP